MNKKHLHISTLFSLLLLSACSSVPKDGGIGEVEKLYVDQKQNQFRLSKTGDPMPMSAEELEALLSAPISLTTAEQIAIELNPMVQSQLGNIGIAEADYAQAARMENPGLSYERFSGDDNSASLIFDIGGVFLIPLKRRMELRRLEAARYEAARGILSHVADTRKAWINAVAENQQTTLMMRLVEAAETSNELTRQMAALGHSSVIDATQSELALSELRVNLVSQRLANKAATEVLIRKLGLWGDQARTLSLPDELPALPDKPTDFPAVEQQAIESRLDMQMAKFYLESTAKNLKLTRLNPFFSAIELGPVLEKAEGEKERGYEIELRLPIFDAGGIKSEKARIVYEQARVQAESTAIVAASESRQALAAYIGSWDIAHHMQTKILPLRQRLSEEQLLQYNGMLISVFDLLNDLQAATAIESRYVYALRDFWLADTNLQNALSGAGDRDMVFSGGAAISAGNASDAAH